MVEKLWLFDHKVCMEIQNGITFDTMLQIGSFFLQNASHVQDISNVLLPCMGKVCMLIISHMFKIKVNLHHSLLA